jgi:hypothetical protein
MMTIPDFVIIPKKERRRGLSYFREFVRRSITFTVKLVSEFIHFTFRETPFMSNSVLPTLDRGPLSPIFFNCNRKTKRSVGHHRPSKVVTLFSFVELHKIPLTPSLTYCYFNCPLNYENFT